MGQQGLPHEAPAGLCNGNVSREKPVIIDGF